MVATGKYPAEIARDDAALAVKALSAREMEVLYTRTVNVGGLWVREAFPMWSARERHEYIRAWAAAVRQAWRQA